MCIIAFGVKGDLKREELENCIINNPDGFFLMAYKDGEREPYLYERTLKSNVILKRFDEIDDNDNFILHARIKTHGSISAKNIHGWHSHGWYFCHNGVLQVKNRDDLTDSETFFQDIFLPACKDNKAVYSKKILRMISSIIGTSKMVLFKEGKLLYFGNFVNPDDVRAVFFSNSSYKSYIQPNLPKRKANYYYGGTSKNHSFDTNLVYYSY